MDGLKQDLIYSQAIFYLGMLICILLAPASLAANTGLSYFGVHAITILLFGLGIAGSAYFLALAAGYIKSPVVRNALRVAAILMVLIVLTPYSISNWFDWIHTVCGTALFSMQLLLAVWLVWQAKQDWLSWLLLAAQIAGGLAALLYLAPSQGLLLQSQLVFQAAFSLLLFRSIRLLAR